MQRSSNRLSTVSAMLARPRLRSHGVALLATAAGAAVFPGAALASAHVAPKLKVLHTTPALARNHHSFVFLAPNGYGPPYGPASAEKYMGNEIVNLQGRPIWFKGVAPNVTTFDFRIQRFLGKPVLTWWQGINAGEPNVSGTDYIYSLSGKLIAKVSARDGYKADAHEFVVNNDGTVTLEALKIRTVNLTKLGGAADQKVGDVAVQTIDLKTGKLLFNWVASKHVPYRQSEEPMPASGSTVWDWFHLNSVHQNTKSDVLINARSTWTVYDVNTHTGRTIWQLGGKHSTLKLRVAKGQVFDQYHELFAWEHDATALGHNKYSVFDDESPDLGSPGLPNSRAEIIRIDPKTKTATLIKSYSRPGVLSLFEGSAQPLANGDDFVGWGWPEVGQACCTLFGRHGSILWNADFAPAGVTNYRAYLEALSRAERAQLASRAWKR